MPHTYRSGPKSARSVSDRHSHRYSDKDLDRFDDPKQYRPQAVFPLASYRKTFRIDKNSKSWKSREAIVKSLVDSKKIDYMGTLQRVTASDKPMSLEEITGCSRADRGCPSTPPFSLSPTFATSRRNGCTIDNDLDDFDDFSLDDTISDIYDEWYDEESSCDDFEDLLNAIQGTSVPSFTNDRVKSAHPNRQSNNATKIADDLPSAKDRIMTANPNKQRNASRTDVFIDDFEDLLNPIQGTSVPSFTNDMVKSAHPNKQRNTTMIADDDLLSAKDRIMTANPNKQRNASRTDDDFKNSQLPPFSAINSIIQRHPLYTHDRVHAIKNGYDDGIPKCNEDHRLPQQNVPASNFTRPVGGIAEKSSSRQREFSAIVPRNTRQRNFADDGRVHRNDLFHGSYLFEYKKRLNAIMAAREIISDSKRGEEPKVPKMGGDPKQVPKIGWEPKQVLRMGGEPKVAGDSKQVPKWGVEPKIVKKEGDDSKQVFKWRVEPKVAQKYSKQVPKWGVEPKVVKKEGDSKQVFKWRVEPKVPLPNIATRDAKILQKKTKKQKVTPINNKKLTGTSKKEGKAPQLGTRAIEKSPPAVASPGEPRRRSLLSLIQRMKAKVQFKKRNKIAPL